MNREQFLRSARFIAALCLSATMLTSCRPELTVPAARSANELRTAKAAATTDMTVSAATPDSATQDTTLDVTISGSGFVVGTAAAWALAGVQDSLQVRTNSTRFVNSRQLVANITISPSATIAKWDVVVTAAGKKGGIGSEAFAIKAKRVSDTNSRVNYVVANQVDVAAPGTPSSIQPAGILGDGRLRDGTSANGADSEYQSAFCAATGSIETMGSPPPGNVFFDPGDGSVPCGERRYFIFNLDGVATQIAPDVRGSTIWSLAVGETGTRVFSFDTRTYRTDTGLANCVVMEFDPAYGGTAATVTRLDNGTGPRKWLVKSTSPHLAACANPTRKGFAATGKKYTLPFAITLTEVPYPWPTFP